MNTDELSERLLGTALAALDMWSIHLGDQLGLYDVLRKHSALSPVELSELADVDRRYATEWLEQQTVTGFLAVDDPSRPADDRRYSLPNDHAEALTDRDSLAYMAPLMRALAAAGTQIPALVHAYRNGGGVPWSQYGSAMRTGQADTNRPWFLRVLGTEWLPEVPELHQRLLAGAKVADVGCGEGWSSIGIALAYPDSTIDGYDLDAASIEAARRHAEDSGVGDRVRFHCGDVAEINGSSSYDVVAAFECIHDLANPIEVLAAMRAIARPDGHVVVMDERVPEEFTGPGDDLERLMYGLSLMICLPDGMSHHPSAGTGTVMRPATLRSYAQSAGFADIETLPIENDMWRFYRLSR